MSKKHFIALADAIRADGTFTSRQVSALAGFCKMQNDDFKASRWFDYIAGNVGPNGGAVKKTPQAVTA